MQRKGALPGKIFARCVPKRRFAGLFGCMARISCQSQPVFGCMARESCRELAIFPSEAAFGMHGAQNLLRIDARERTAAESCHGKTPGNAPREYIATASRAKSASGRNPATVERWGWRTARAFCHRRAPGNAYSQRLADRAASSCGRAYCLAIALVPYESDDLFVQAVLHEKGARRPAHGDDTLSRWLATERKVGARCPVHGGVR